MLQLGLNPFYNGYGVKRGKYNLNKILITNISEGMTEIKKIKQCIFEGYRMELYIWSEGVNSYISVSRHNSVNIDSKLIKNLSVDDSDVKQNRPLAIIVGITILSQSLTSPGMYDFNGSLISILDGFVDFDINFINA